MGAMGNKKAKRKESGSAQPVPGLSAQADEELDLHGLAVDEAMAQVELAMERYRRRPGARLRIIHGQSNGLQGTIKGSLRRNLETIWKGRIDSFRPEPGNPGATLIRLA